MNITFVCTIGGVIGLLITFLFHQYYRKRFEKVLPHRGLMYFTSAFFNVVYSALYFTHQVDSLRFLGCIILIPSLIVLARIDAKEQVIPNVLLAMLLLARLILTVVCSPSLQTIVDELSSSFLGIMFATFAFVVSRMFSKNSVGMGDIKLFAVLGVYFGHRYILSVVVLSLVCALLYGLMRFAKNKCNLNESFGLAPSIACGASMILWIMGV